MTPSPPVLKTPNSSNSQLVSVTLECRTHKRNTSSNCETMHGRETCVIYMNRVSKVPGIARGVRRLLERVEGSGLDGLVPSLVGFRKGLETSGRVT